MEQDTQKDVQKTAQETYRQMMIASQFNVGPIPFHTHNRIDSNQINFNDLIFNTVGITATIVITVVGIGGITTTLNFTKGLLTSYTQI